MIHPPLLEFIPNISEGRNHKALDQLWLQLQAVPELYCLHQHRDEDHHRTVLTLAGSPASLTTATHQLYDWAIRHIDLQTHQGEHPRMGAVDVCPLVPLEGLTLSEAVQFSRTLARSVAERWQLPVFLYEQSTAPGKEHRLPFLRQVWRTQQQQALTRADYGSAHHHAGLGASVWGVRGPLIAWNVWLNSQDLKLAQQIAHALRERNGGFAALRTLGLYLPRANRVQISMNLIDPQQSSLFDIYRAIESRARQAGVEVERTEFIGLVPESVFFETTARFLKAEPGLAGEHGLNSRLRATKNRDFRDFFA